jgi:hypothetical protein
MLAVTHFTEGKALFVCFRAIFGGENGFTSMTNTGRAVRFVFNRDDA